MQYAIRSLILIQWRDLTVGVMRVNLTTTRANVLNLTDAFNTLEDGGYRELQLSSNE